MTSRRPTGQLARIYFCCLTIALLAPSAQAATIGYWRMEADSNAGNGYSIANEIGGGSALTGSNGGLDVNVPVATIPQTGAANIGTLDGNTNLAGTIAHYGALDTGSITVEFWARTQEATGTFISRQSGAIGLLIDTPNAMRVQYSVDDGAGGSSQITINTTQNFDSPWVHTAFTYDQATGTGSVYINGTQIASNTGVAGRALTWTAAQNISIGPDFDGGPISGSSGQVSGILDELRISNVALAPNQFLNATPVPEPGTCSLLLLGTAGLGWAVRKRRGQVRPR